MRTDPIGMLKAMLAAANRFPDNRSTNPAHFVSELRDELRNRRKAQRQKFEQTKGWLQRYESIQIINMVSAQFTTRKSSEEINVGPDVGVIKTGSFRGRPALKITVGHMWYRRVWQNLYQDSRFTNAHDYFILSAIEYKINVPSIRLWKATVWSFKETITLDGYIGQSTFDKMPCAFRLDAQGAITAAKRLTHMAVKQKMITEGEQQ